MTEKFNIGDKVRLITRPTLHFVVNYRIKRESTPIEDRNIVNCLSIDGNSITNVEINEEFLELSDSYDLLYDNL